MSDASPASRESSWTDLDASASADQAPRSTASRAEKAAVLAAATFITEDYGTKQRREA
jgi:hypothetical protein